MKAVVIRDGRVACDERPDPQPEGDEVLVKVAGAGLNRADLIQVGGGYPAPPGSPADIPGLEFAGTVAARGPRARTLEEGDRVFGVVGGGGQAEFLVTTEDHCARVPGNLDLADAGAIPEVYITAHDAMVTQAGLKPGERVLVHAVGSGVGTAVVQIAVAMGCEVVGTARTADKLARAEGLGMAAGVLVDGPPDAAAIAKQAGPCHVVIDLVGGDYLAADLMSVATKGRIVIVGLLAGAVTQMNMGLLMQKRCSVTGTTLRARPRAEKAAATALFSAQMVPLFERGQLQPIIEARFPADEVQQAYDLVAANTTFGKVVLTF